jgi:DMSO/TMAO reductase YedYZ heme-binding membrane subunit
VATTRSRPPRGREQARHASGGAIGEHAAKVYGIAIGGAVVIVAVLAFTSVGHVIDAAVQHFMLYYAGVFTLIALCSSVGLGFVATDRMVLSPGHRVFVQSAHRAVSFGALAFLIVHITTEILAQRVHLLDAVIPFLSPFRTFYIGLGTIASDLIILLVITSIYRKRFTTNGNAWRWRAIHYCAYASFLFGVWHGLLGGRAGKAYVDWSYGLVIAFVALGLGIRMLANSLRPKENLSSAPVSEASSSGSAPMRAAAMFAQLGIMRAASASAGPMSVLMPGGGAGTRAALPAAGGRTGPMPAIAALPAPVMSDTVLGYGDAGTGRQPVYEPGYDGPPRYAGAPRNQGTGPMPRAATGPMPRAVSGPMPRAGSGPLPRAGTGPMPRAATGPMPRAGTGPLPRAATGPLPRAGTGPMPRAGSGPLPRVPTGPLPRVPTGPYPVGGSAAGGGPAAGAPHGRGRGPAPRPQTGPMPRPQTGPMPRADSGPMTRPQSGPLPRVATGSFPAATGRASRPATGPMPRPATGAFPAAGYSVGPPARDLPAGRPDGASSGGPRPAAMPPWDSGLPMGDPALRYREPGPGMPGYRGGETRGGNSYDGGPYDGGPYDGGPYDGGPYDGGPYDGGPYDGGPYPAGPYTRDSYAADSYRADSYTPDSYTPDSYTPDSYTPDSYRADSYAADSYSADRYAAGRPPADQHAASHYPGDPHGAPQYPPGQYPPGRPPHAQPPPDRPPHAQPSPGQYPGDPYSADPYATDPQYPAGQYPAAQYPTAPYPAPQYPADPYWDGRR